MTKTRIKPAATMWHHPQFRTAYQLIREHYGERCAKRSGILLMNHIDEGLAILKGLEASWEEAAAFCLHPLLQDGCSSTTWRGLCYRFDQGVTWLLVTYVGLANKYLPKAVVKQTLMGMGTNPIDLTGIGPGGVRLMLVADKIQNRKDFKLHWNKYSNWSQLTTYFDAWLKALDLDDEEVATMTKWIS